MNPEDTIKKYKELLNEEWVSIVLKRTECVILHESGKYMLISNENLKTYDVIAQGFPQIYEWCRKQAYRREIPFENKLAKSINNNISGL